MNQEELMERIRKEYPEFLPDAEEMSKSGEDLTELLSALDSFY